MDDETLGSIIKVLGLKIHDLTGGFGAMFNLCVDHGLFDEAEFHQERKKVEASPDLVKLRRFLERLPSPKGDVDLEELLRDYEGPPQ